MLTCLGPGTYAGYCGNVARVKSWDDCLAVLQRLTPAIRAALGSDQPIGVGLWLPADLAAQRDGEGSSTRPTEDQRIKRLAALEAAQSATTSVFTINGFPYCDFQAERVKHDVYLPDWTTIERAKYTSDLIRAAGEFASRGGPASGRSQSDFSISTLPIGWRANFRDPARLASAARLLVFIADVLRDHHDATSQHVHLDLEPEPGCVFETSRDVVEFFEQHLLPGRDETLLRKYLGVCHDVCHAAVMGEPQEQAFLTYKSAGINVGKVQLSSAIRVNFDAVAHADRQHLLGELSRFVEGRFLHQTVIAPALPTSASAEIAGRRSLANATFYDDLPDAIAANNAAPSGEWRTHFHVPIHLAKIGGIETTQSEIQLAIAAARRHSTCRHFEVETYAWPVLPQELREADLATGIARELAWLRQLA